LHLLFFGKTLYTYLIKEMAGQGKTGAMIPLDQSQYDKVVKPLSEVTINNLFAYSVVEKHVPGIIYVDHVEEPKTFYVIHTYGMSLLLGETERDAFNSKLLDYALNTYNVRNKIEWVQAFPESWHKKLSTLLGDHLFKSNDRSAINRNGKIEEDIRVNFKFNIQKYLYFRRNNIHGNLKILRTDKEMYENIQGSVIPQYFWRDADHFYNRGVGYTLIYDKKLVSTAFSSFIHDHKLEIGIETSENYQSKKFAMYVCSSLIDYCLENNYEPIWACRAENIGSYKLAYKLGFEPTISIPYYKLNV